ncbi:MAG TPA: Asp-tRNA(Asn)/Glu-tRNA(Gln) amidotransferase subunit GatC [Bacteroidia bacterium]|nr:Asp-tRNA(Asn)/Glu-tRNA(Gln) amidotransferase subunit GatC [Bacteroidia bacterium]
MQIDESTVDRLAVLARLEFDAETKKEMVKDLARIISFVDKLKELDTSNVEPLIYMNDEVNVLREDIVKQVITHQEAMLNAPKKDSDFFKVPKVIGGKK